MGFLSTSGVPSSSKVPMPAPSGFLQLCLGGKLPGASNSRNVARTRRGPPLIPNNRHITLVPRRLVLLSRFPQHRFEGPIAKLINLHHEKALRPPKYQRLNGRVQESTAGHTVKTKLNQQLYP